MAFKYVIIFLYIACIASPAQGALDRTLQKMQEKYKNVHTLTAKFLQKQKKITLGTTIESSGVILIKLPKMFRWETKEPSLERSVLISDGKTLWYYTPPLSKGEKGKLMVRKATDVQSRLAIDLLSGQSNLKKSFKIKNLQGWGAYELIPLKPAGDIEHIELFIEPKTYLVYKIILITSIGNKTELVLKEVTLEPTINDSLFHFSPPKGTEEIQ